MSAADTRIGAENYNKHHKENASKQHEKIYFLI